METQSEVTLKEQLFAVQQKNLVYNYNFLNYSNATGSMPVVYNHPDGWVYSDTGSGGQITYDATKNCCEIVNSASGQMSFTQALNEFPRASSVLNGKQVTAAAVVSSPVSGCQLTFFIDDGVERTTKSVTFKTADPKTISINIDVDPNATQLIVGIESQSANAAIYIYSVCANIGAVALASLPCMVDGFIGERKQYLSTDIPPATELSLCQASAPLPAGYSRLNSVLNGKFGTGSNGNSMLPSFSGYFSRAWDNGAGIDPDAAYRTALGTGTVKGDNVGTVEQDQFMQHTHQLQFTTSGQVTAQPSVAASTISQTSTSNTQPSGGSETRGKNISELYTMKWA